MMKAIEVTPGVMAVIRRLQGGELITVTHKDEETLYEMKGGKVRADVLAAAFVALRDAGMLEEQSPGLFSGCGQAFCVVRQ